MLLKGDLKIITVFWTGFLSSQMLDNFLFL